MAMQKKSLISNRKAVKKALVATSVGKPTKIASPAKVVTGPSKFVTGPSKFVTGPSKFVTGPSKFITGPSKVS